MLAETLMVLNKFRSESGVLYRDGLMSSRPGFGSLKQVTYIRAELDD